MDDIDGHMMGLLILCSTVKLIFIPLTRDAIPKTTARHGSGTVDVHSIIIHCAS